MVQRFRSGVAGLTATVLLAGWHIPANSPLTGLAQLRPHGMPHTNVLPPAAMLQHPGPGVEGRRGKRHALLAGGPVAEEPDGIQRFTGAAGADGDGEPGQRQNLRHGLSG